MSGSNMSNLGYGREFPLSNVNGAYVNRYATNSAGDFGSRVIPGLPGLSGAKSNIDAAAGRVPGVCTYSASGARQSGGYRYPASLRRPSLSSVKRRHRRNMWSKYMTRGRGGGRRRRNSRRRRSRNSHRRRNRLYGGYAQYQNNLPLSNVYSVGGVLSSSSLGLANPPPIRVLPNCTNCVDNYNHYTNTGFPSRGH